MESSHTATPAPPRDTDNITITLTRSVALELVKLAGLEPDDRGRYGGKYWALDEAATVAAVAIAENDLPR